MHRLQQDLGRSRRHALLAVAAAAAGVVTLAGCSLSPARDAAASGAAAPTIAGTWVVTVSPPSPAPSFQSTIVFTRDGAVIEATAKPFAAPAADMSEGLGVWSAAGDTVHMTFQKYLFDAQGHSIGRTVIVETDTLDPKGGTYTGKAVTTIYDPAGNTLATFPSTSTAQRMAL